MVKLSGKNGLPRVVAGLIFMLLPGVFCGTAAADKNAPSPDDFVVVDTMPEMIKQQAPVYPPKAVKEKIEGEVWIKALVNVKGEVDDALVAKYEGPDVGFEEAALTAAKGCLYKPALQNKQPVAVWISYKVSFVLDEKKK